MLRRVAKIEQADAGSITRAAGIIRRGGLVAFPTETVYGLGADGLNAEAVAGIFKAKGRPQDNPLILHIARKEDVYALAAEVSEPAQRLMDAFWPGALTLILPKRAHIPDAVTGGLGTVGIRMPANAVAQALILESGRPVAAPSANLSGRPSPTLAEHVAQDIGGRIDMILDGGATDWGLESTVAEVTDAGVCILRPGAVTPEAIAGQVPGVYLSGAVAGAPKAPGMKYRHYSPEAELTLVTGDSRRVTEAIREMAARSAEAAGILACEQTRGQYDSRHEVLSLGDARRTEELGAHLFACLRELDRRGVKRIYAEGIDERGMGLAVMNRLRKAASTVVEV